MNNKTQRFAHVWPPLSPHIPPGVGVPKFREPLIEMMKDITIMIIIYIWIDLQLSSSSHWYSGKDVCKNKLSLLRNHNKPSHDLQLHPQTG